jgi:hypothetical protein
MRGAISKSGGNASLARAVEKVWRSLHGHEGESWRQAKVDLKPVDCSALEGRASVVRQSPKGMRRTTGP